MSGPSVQRPMNGMIVDPCIMFGQEQVRQVVAMALAGAMIEPIDVPVGRLQLFSLQLENASCPNLRVDINGMFRLEGLIALSWTVRLSARVTLRFTPGAGGMGRAVSVCLTEIRLLSISIPSNPGLEQTALNLAGMFLPSELCVDVTGLLNGGAGFQVRQ